MFVVGGRSHIMPKNYKLRLRTFAQKHILPKNYEFAFVTIDSWDVCWPDVLSEQESTSKVFVISIKGTRDHTSGAHLAQE